MSFVHLFVAVADSICLRGQQVEIGAVKTNTSQIPPVVCNHTRVEGLSYVFNKFMLHKKSLGKMAVSIRQYSTSLLGTLTKAPWRLGASLYPTTHTYILPHYFTGDIKKTPSHKEKSLCLIHDFRNASS